MTHPDQVKIAYLTAEFPALSHTFILREILALEAQGLQVVPVSVRTPGASGTLGPDEKAMGSRTRYLLQQARNPLTLIKAQISGLRSPGRYFAALALAFKTRPPGLRALIYQAIYFAEATLLARTVADENCTHIHNHFANSSGTVAMLASKLADVPFSFTLHGPSDLFDAKHWRLDRKIAEAKFVACISHFARSQAMLNSKPDDWGKLRIVHCGVEPAKYTATPPKPGKGPRLIFVGRLAPVKGLRVLLEALPDVLKTQADTTVTIVGDGPDRATLQKMAAPLGDAVRFTGPLSQSEVADELARADMMVLPSFAEGVPVVLMEALASARPVIATQVAGVGELVKDGINGRVVSPGDRDGLRDAILDLAGNPDLRAKMGQQGRVIVDADFNIATEAAWLAQIFTDKAGDALRPAR